jgi:serine/threonine protein phosphatase 1
MTKPIYAIGDVHGQLAELDRVLDLIEADGGSDSQIVFLGDYTDRGPDSYGVLDRIIDGKAEGRDWITLMGNHDRMFRMFLQSPPQADPYMMVELYWLHPRLGGDTTLASYGLPVSPQMRLKDLHAAALASVPKRHVDFLNSLQLTHQKGDLFFVHAGIRPGVPIADQTEEDLIWIRQKFHTYNKPHPHLIVHGHTPVKKATHYGNRINLDSGAGYGDPLSAAVFEGDEAWLLTDRGRKRLKPGLF